MNYCSIDQCNHWKSEYFNISACSQARKKIQTATGMVSGVNGDTPKSAKYQQNSKIEMCNYTNLKNTRVIFERINMFIFF